MKEGSDGAGFGRAVLFGTLASLVAGTIAGGGGYALAREGALYALWLFVLVPIVMGLAGAAGANWKRSAPILVGVATGFASLFVGVVVLLVLQREGILCALMATPVYLLFYLPGYLLGHALLERRGGSVMATVLPLAAFATLGAARAEPPVTYRTETTTLDIAAPPERVWPLLFQMEGVPAPSGFLFRAGVAHPVAIRSSCEGIGARRECALTTGTMPERISVSQRFRRLRFDVLDTPPSMRELNPFGEVHAAHLRGSFTVRYGEFRLIPLANGGTRLVGESGYSLRLGPGAYWALWSDSVVEGVHRGVTEEIRRRAERG